MTKIQSQYFQGLQKIDHTNQTGRKKFKRQELRIDITLKNGGSHTFYVNIWYSMNGSFDTGQ